MVSLKFWCKLSCKLWCKFVNFLKAGFPFAMAGQTQRQFVVPRSRRKANSMESAGRRAPLWALGRLDLGTAENEQLKTWDQNCPTSYLASQQDLAKAEFWPQKWPHFFASVWALIEAPACSPIGFGPHDLGIIRSVFMQDPRFFFKHWRLELTHWKKKKIKEQKAGRNHWWLTCLGQWAP